ncbi:unnamed protein product [Anisakis simplex]|uniref:Uncharacterized protein n=1 Tax=Anisakis simplex TaxID=6269 RepID=A0A0M3KGC9_ANISI|nr:unnamed protein product [Anisakis simplex]
MHGILPSRLPHKKRHTVSNARRATAQKMRDNANARRPFRGKDSLNASSPDGSIVRLCIERCPPLGGEQK